MSKESTRPQCEQLEERCLPSVTIQLNYSLDSNGFFANASRRTVLERAAQMLASRLSDTLAPITPWGSDTWTPGVIHPSTGAMRTLPSSTSVPADTIVVYVGGRDLPGGQVGEGGSGYYSAAGSQAWLNRVASRGEPGAVSATPTDYAPAIGFLSFDTVGTNWHFGGTTSGLTSGKTDFMSVAMHELGHVLGLGVAPSWDRLTTTGSFRGANARAVNGGRNVPLTPDRAHFAEGTRNPNGVEAAMDPSVLQGRRKFFGGLDFAALKDIGWEVRRSDDTLLRAQDTQGATAARIQASMAFFASLDRKKDVDIYRVYVAAGDRLAVDVGARSGGIAVDTYLRVYDATGGVLATANQGGVGGRDSLALNVTRSDYYFIAVSSSANRDYDPFATKSGSGGPLGDYRIGISID